MCPGSILYHMVLCVSSSEYHKSYVNYSSSLWKEGHDLTIYLAIKIGKLLFISIIDLYTSLYMEIEFFSFLIRICKLSSLMTALKWILLH